MNKAENNTSDKIILINDDFRQMLKIIIKEHKIRNIDLCKAIKKDKSYLSHIFNQNINKLRSSDIDIIIQEIISKATIGMNRKESKKIGDSIRYRIEQTFPDSVSRHMWSQLFTAEHAIDDREIIEMIIDDLQEVANYTPSQFIEEIVNVKGELQIINYDKGLKTVQHTFSKNYIENLLLDEAAEQHEKTTYEKLFIIVYRYWELIQSLVPEEFESFITELHLKHSRYFTVKTSSELSNDALLRQVTYDYLFLFEYPSLVEYINYFNSDQEYKEDVKLIQSMWSRYGNDPDFPEMTLFGSRLKNLDNFQKRKGNENFFKTINNFLDCQDYDYICAIYGKDYLKIKGPCNRDGFKEALNALFEEWSSKPEA